MEEEAERVAGKGEPARQFAARGQLAQGGCEALRPREDVAHREHHEGADPVGDGPREDFGARVLVHHVKRDHHHVPHLVLDGALQHIVLGVVRGGLGDAEMAELAFRPLLQQRRGDHVARLGIGFGQHTVQLEDVDVVGIEPAQ